MSTSHRLQNRIAVVTGAGSGIGRASAIRLATEGARVALTGRNLGRLQEVEAQIKQLGGLAHCYQLDVCKTDDVTQVFKKIAADHGKIHILVNNAGISGPTPLESATPKQWVEILNTNLVGAFFCCQAAVTAMPDNAGGRIINISSIGGQTPFPGWSAYCASKAGMVGITRCLALELAPRGITVNAVLPGWVETEMARAGVAAIASDMRTTPEQALPLILQQVPLSRMSSPEEIASMVSYLATDEACGITGASMVIANGAWM